jgi:hypothetical protein
MLAGLGRGVRALPFPVSSSIVNSRLHTFLKKQMDLPRLNVITFMTEYKILTYFKPSFRCIFLILVINPILKGVVSSVVKAVVYPYLYFYKMPIRL